MNKRKILALLFIGLLLSCGNEKKSNSPYLDEAPASAPITEDYPYAKDSVDNTGNVVDVVDNDLRTNKMFADLNFTDEQIDQYRTIAREERENWKATNANAVINAQERVRQEARNMKALLKPAQYEQYQQWRKDNPLKE
ncbi:hypothetical protein MWU76_13080 [Gelidibacter sp. F2691]|nr:hypothetical protein [Gelidibacter sp. F2691]